MLFEAFRDASTESELQDSQNKQHATTADIWHEVKKLKQKLASVDDQYKVTSEATATAETRLATAASWGTGRIGESSEVIAAKQRLVQGPLEYADARRRARAN